MPLTTLVISLVILNSQLSNITPIFGDITHAAFESTITASTDYDATNGTLTHKFKSQAGLLPTVLNDTDAFNLLRKGYNFYGDHASVSQQYIYWQEGTITGKYIFADNFNYCECCGLETIRQLRITKARALSNEFQKNQTALAASLKSPAASTIQPDKSQDLFYDFQVS